VEPDIYWSRAEKKPFVGDLLSFLELGFGGYICY
jgi:hypothetical protein